MVWGLDHLVVYVLMRMAAFSSPHSPLQGGDCALYSLLWVSGVWNEPGPIVWRESRLCLSEKCLLQSSWGWSFWLM